MSPSHTSVDPPMTGVLLADGVTEVPMPAALQGRTSEPAAGASPEAAAIPPVTASRIRICLHSADFWAGCLPRFADRMQRRSDTLAIAAALLSALTGLAVWGALANDEAWWARAAVSVVALAAAAIGVVPKVKNYGEAAGNARQLATQYGLIKGQLADALEWIEQGHYNDGYLRQLVDNFEATKRSKDSLTPYPRREQDERNAQGAAGGDDQL